jgi:mono/diheme cytochrome c family protein
MPTRFTRHLPIVRRGSFAAVLAVAWLASAAAALTAQGPSHAAPQAAAATAADIQPILSRYCLTCHNQRLQTGGLMLDTLDLATVPRDAPVWEKVVRKVRAGVMPPAGAPRPDQPTMDRLAAWLETTIDRAAAAAPNPGSPALHRLNRAEYGNAIRDLLDLEVDPAALLPPDDSSSGFDNNADALGVSPALVDHYLSAARKISALAVGSPRIGPSTVTHQIRGDTSQDHHIEGLPLGTRGGLVATHTFPLDGEYVLKVKLLQTTLGTVRGLEHPHQVEVLVDGAQVHVASVGGEADYSASPVNATDVVNDLDRRLTVRVPVQAGRRRLAATFVQKTNAGGGGRMHDFVRTTVDTTDHTGLPHIESITVIGPFNATGPGDTASRRRIFVCQPAFAKGFGGASPTSAKGFGGASPPSAKGSGETSPPSSRGSTPRAEATCAATIISKLARRAYRRPVTEEELSRLLTVYRDGRGDGTFETGIERALRAILASSKFVFRLERDPANLAAGTPHRIADIELASRLSFFLWGSIPDDELIDLASRRRLNAPAVLERQVRRMLADHRAQTLVGSFAGQWLQLRNLASSQPDQNDFPDFDDNLRRAFQRETELLFETVMREDRSVLDFVTADYTFVNERLARHYGIGGIYGSHFRRITLAEDARRGLLGKGAILMITSHPDRTSPVVRGKWILENLLGTPPPPPPAAVPPLEEQRSAKPRTLREQMESHRASAACAGCHRLIDPIGFALENFDAVGAWRTRDAGAPVDASSQLTDGTAVDGVVALRQALLKRPEVIVGTFTEKLMTYALGRGLDYYDRPAVRAIVRQAAMNDYRFSEIVLGIVKSTPFQMRVAASSELPASSARSR